VTTTQSKAVLEFLRVNRGTGLAHFGQPSLEKGAEIHLSIPLARWEEMDRERVITVTVVPGNEFENDHPIHPDQGEIPLPTDPDYAEWARTRGIAGSQIRR
jgi:hypothetical protein